MVKYKYDSFVNALTSLGTSGDKVKSTVFHIDHADLLYRETLEALYAFEGLARKIVTMLPREMLRQGWRVKIDQDENKAIESAIERQDKRLMLDKALNKACVWDQLYGGSAILLGVNDGQEDFAEPVDKERIQSIDFAVPMAPYQLPVVELGRNPLSPYFDQPLYYALAHGSQERIHASRVLHFAGNDLPPEYSLTDNMGYGISVLQLAYRPLLNLSTSYDNLTTMIHEYNQAVFQIEGLMGMLAEGEDGYDVVRQRLRLMNMSRSTVNALILQDGESFETKSLDMRGLADIIDKLILHVCAVTNAPATRFAGMSPAGLSATGESDMQNWYEYASGEQEMRLRHPLERYYAYSLASIGRNGAGFNLEFNPIAQMSDEEEATLRKTHAETDNLHYTMGVLTADEIAESRFGGDEYGTDIQLDKQARAGWSGGMGENDWTAAQEMSSTVEGDEDITTAELVPIVQGVRDGSIPVESAIEILSISYPHIPRARFAAMVLPAASNAGGVSGGTPASPAAPEPSGNDTPLADNTSIPQDAQSAKAIASKLGFSGSRSVMSLWKQGKIRAWKLGGRYLVSESEVEKAIAQGVPLSATNIGPETESATPGDSD